LLAKFSDLRLSLSVPSSLAAPQTKLEVPYDSPEKLEAGKMVVQLLQDLAMPPDLKQLDLDRKPLAPSLAVQVRCVRLPWPWLNMTSGGV